MKAFLRRFDGAARHRSAVAVVGSWDPLTASHRSLFRSLCRRARRLSASALCILLHPPPSRWLHSGAAVWPEYNGLEARIARLRESGVDAVLVVGFTRADLDATSRAFFDVVAGRVALGELWLGANQTLGSGSQGAAEAIADLARRRRISLRRLQPDRQRTACGMVHRWLAEGRVRDVVREVGYVPVWKRPCGGTVLRLGWLPGRYLVAPLASPTARVEPDAEPVGIELIPGRSSAARLIWPRADAVWLGVLAGPADDVALAGTGGGAEVPRTARIASQPGA